MIKRQFSLSRMYQLFFLFVCVLTLLETPSAYFGATAYAAETDDPNYDYALKLKALGVFIGSDAGFELSRQPKRIEGLVMLIRLLGSESQALALADDPCVFVDVPKWAVGYANYAVSHQLTLGKSATVFGSDDPLTLEQYTTFLLRSLQYSDTKGDFTFQNVLTKGYDVGILSTASKPTATFTRSELAKLSYTTLLLPIKQSTTSLAQYLVNLNVMDKTTAIAIQVISNPAVIDGMTYALKDPLFYDLGETTASIDVLSSATIQGASKSDVLDHNSAVSTATKSVITLPIDGYSRLVFRIITSRSTTGNTLSIYEGRYTTLSALSKVPIYKIITSTQTSQLYSIDLTQLTNTKDITFVLSTDGKGHLYVYNLFLE